MARLPRICLPDIPLHVIQRGNNRLAGFGGNEDFSAYAHWLEEYSRKFRVAIHAWVFMTNHVHLLLINPGQRGFIANIRNNSSLTRFFRLSPQTLP